MLTTSDSRDHLCAGRVFYELRQRWEDLLLESLDVLRQLRMAHGIAVAERVAKAISAERDWARNNQVEERNALIEALMVPGEQVNFQALVTEDFDLQSALENWHAFCSDASCKCKLYPVLGHFKCACLLR